MSRHACQFMQATALRFTLRLADGSRPLRWRLTLGGRTIVAFIEDAEHSAHCGADACSDVCRLGYIRYLHTLLTRETHARIMQIWH